MFYSRILAIMACIAGPSIGAGQNIDAIAGNLLGHDVTHYANQAVATFGLVAVPNETASAFTIRNTSRDTNSFTSIQVGGGGVPKFFDRPIYVEGFLGYQRYDPQFLIKKDQGDDLTVRAYWNGFAATIGAGWDFDLGNNWSFRPIGNLTIGHIVSDATLVGGITEAALDVDLGFLFGEGVTTGGYGASALFTYDYNAGHAEYDIRLRHTHLRLQSIGKSSHLNARATAITTSAWARARYPIKGWRVMQRPVKSMYEASVSIYPGDQAKLLDIGWLARVGAGVEFDTTATWVPIIKKGRVAVRYIFGEDYQGLSLGIGFGLDG
jgi:hypothetical protein